MLQRENDHLKMTVADLTQSLAALSVKNRYMEDEKRQLSIKIQDLIEELSVKESEWCEKEESMKLEVGGQAIGLEFTVVPSDEVILLRI